MKYICAASTDVGLKKKNNQDSLMVKHFLLDNSECVFAVVCDGVGGLSSGELASTTVIRKCEKWLLASIDALKQKGDLFEFLIDQWQNLINDCNDVIQAYGKKQGLTLGTTMAALFLKDDNYYVVNVGDSRVYKLIDKAEIITKDQTIVEYELEHGVITAEEAANDKRKSVLLQCIGASTTIIPDFFTGKIIPNSVFMLCSDGFRHLLTQEELLSHIGPQYCLDSENMTNNQRYLIDLNKQRNEQDNISVISIKVMPEES